MKHQHTLRVIALAGLGPLLGANALAQIQGPEYFYGGLSIGSSRGNFKEAEIANNVAGPGTGITGVARDDRSTAYRLFGGYQFNRYFGMEAGFFDLGKFGFLANTTPDGTIKGDYKVIGGNLDVLGTLPFTDRFSMFGRVGANWARTRDRFSTTGAATLSNPQPSARGTNPKVGVGLQYALTPSLLLRGEAERYRVKDATGQRGDVNVLSVGLVMPFGRAPAPRAAVTPYTPPQVVAQVERPAPPPPAPEPVVVAPPPPPPPAPPAPPVPRRVSYSAESIFGFDQSTIAPQGRAALDTFAGELRGAQFEVVTVQGHTDRLGSTAYNQALSLQRADAVKSYLVNNGGMPSAKVNAQGLGETMPVTKPGECKGERPTAALIGCLQPDRRVDIEVVGTR